MDEKCSCLPFRHRQSFKPVTVWMNQLFNCFVYTLCYVTAKQSLRHIIINIPTPPVPMRPAFTAHSLLSTPAPFFIPFADSAKRVTGELEFLSKQSWETEMCSDTAVMPKVCVCVGEQLHISKCQSSVRDCDRLHAGGEHAALSDHQTG